MARILLVGCGYVGNEVAKRLQGRGDEVWILNRRGVPEGERIHSLRGDVSALESIPNLPLDLHAVSYIVSASGHNEEAYFQAYVQGVQNVVAVLTRQQSSPKRILFVSSTSVYGQSEGEWVDEDSETKPEGFSGKMMLRGEAAVQNAPFESVVLRLGGIYGPQRDRMIRQLLANEDMKLTPGHSYTNRNHRDDCAGAILHLLDLESPYSVYLGVDHDPADRKDVVHWLAKRLRRKDPTVQLPIIEQPAAKGGPITEAEIEKPTRFGANKRCRNQRLIDSGYEFRYPSFQDGYGAMLRDMGF